MRKIILFLCLATGILSCTSSNKTNKVEKAGKTLELPLSDVVRVNFKIYKTDTYRICMELQNITSKSLYIPEGKGLFKYLYAYKKDNNRNIDLTEKTRRSGISARLIYRQDTGQCQTMISKEFLTKNQKDSVKHVMHQLFPREIIKKIANQYDSIKHSMLAKKYPRSDVDQVGIGFIPRCLETMIEHFVFLEPNGFYSENIILDTELLQYDKLYLYFRYPNDRHMANRITWNTFLDNVKYPEQINGYEFHYRTIVSDTIEFVRPKK